ncbi:ABC transporter substrate-binding protein [Naumannella halotolerans]|nr:sugar ABC transporter substrate-binding protein [Naumannella halotolerans]
MKKVFPVLLAGAVLTTSGCAGFGRLGEQAGVTTITVATVNNSQMQDMSELIDDFEAAHPDIRVNMLFMEENDLRAAITKDVATGGGQYDVMTVGSYEVPIWGQNGWLRDLTDDLGSDPDYDLDDLIGPIREAASYEDRLYAAPFYGESSFLMYRKDIFEELGLQIPDNPTWDEVAQLAEQANAPEEGRAGICMRGKPGWGETGAVLGSMVNTFGGQWYDMEWNATVNTGGFAEATNFYVDLVRNAGEADPVSYGFTECLNLFGQGGAAMWYDATSAAGQLESDDSPVQGEVGYVPAPVVETEQAGWLWSWNLGVNAASTKQEAATEFVKWATSPEYLQLVGEEQGWSNLPPGTRESTYELPEYQEVSSAYGPLTEQVISEVDPAHPGVLPQPWVGVQYVSIPEFQDVGNQATQAFADAFAGRKTTAEALDEAQRIAERGAAQQRQETGQ